MSSHSSHQGTPLFFTSFYDVMECYRFLRWSEGPSACFPRMLMFYRSCRTPSYWEKVLKWEFCSWVECSWRKWELQNPGEKWDANSWARNSNKNDSNVVWLVVDAILELHNNGLSAMVWDSLTPEERFGNTPMLSGGMTVSFLNSHKKHEFFKGDWYRLNPP